MYKNFSDECIRVIMRAHKLAVELKCPYIDTLLFLLALLREFDSFAPIANRCGLTEDMLLRDIDQRIGKTQFVAFTLTIEPAAVSFLDDLTRCEQVVYVCDMFSALMNSSSIRSLLKPKEEKISTARWPTKSPREWLGPETCAVHEAAEARARADVADEIRVEHLLAASAELIEWLPDRLRKGIYAIQPVRTELSSVGQSQGDLRLSTDASVVLCEARERAQCFACNQIKAEHILYCALRAVNGDLMRMFAQVLSERLYSAGTISMSSQELQSETKRISITLRLMEVLKQARSLAGERDPKVADYFDALFKESTQTGVNFITNRAPDITDALESIRLHDERIPLRTLLLAALEHGLRLGSTYLDVNHLGLALLDYDNESVSIAVAALCSGAYQSQRRHYVLRQRLERCVGHQRLQGASDEPLVVVDLDDLGSI